MPEPAKQLGAIESRETQRRVEVAMQKLPDRQRLALTLFHFEGLSQIEIGQIMGVSDEAMDFATEPGAKAIEGGFEIQLGVAS